MAINKALSIQKEHLRKGVSSFVSSHKKTIMPIGKEVHLAFEGLVRRCKALLMDSNVDALILVVQTDELTHSELPVDRIDDLILIKEELDAFNETQKKILIKRLELLTT